MIYVAYNFCFELFGDPAGTRTQGPNIKSVVLYQLSYEIILCFVFWECKNSRKTYCTKV